MTDILVDTKKLDDRGEILTIKSLTYIIVTEISFQRRDT